jgi:hypothetical protein
VKANENGGPFHTHGPGAPIRMLRKLLERVGPADQRQFAQVDHDGQESAGRIRIGDGHARKLIAAMKVSLDGKVTNADSVQAWSDDNSLMPEIDACVLGAGMYTGYEPYWTSIQAEPDKPGSTWPDQTTFINASCRLQLNRRLAYFDVRFLRLYRRLTCLFAPKS